MFQSRTRPFPVTIRRPYRRSRPLCLEQLETREMLSGSPFSFTLTGADSVTLVVANNGAEAQLSDSQGVLASPLLTDISQFTVNGAPGVADTLTIDYSGGLFNLPIQFNGASAGTDSLVILNGQFTKATYAPTGPGAGFVQADTQSIAYTGLSALQDIDTSANRTFDFTGLPSGSQHVRLTTAGAGQFTLDSNGTGNFLAQTVGNPSGTLTITGGDSATTFDLGVIPGVPVAITGGAGNDILVLHDGIAGSVSFDGQGGTNTVVNPAALGNPGSSLTENNVAQTVDPVAYVNDALSKVQAFIDKVKGVVSPVLNKQLPLVGKSIGDLLNTGATAIGYNFFDQIKTPVDQIPSNTTVTRATQTIAGVLGLSSDQFNITIDDTASGPVMSLNFAIDLDRQVDYPLDLSTGPVQSSNLLLTAALNLKTQFSIGINFSNYIANPLGGVGTDDMSIKVDQFEMGATLTAKDLTTSLSLPGIGSIALNDGTISAGGVLDVSLNNNNNPLTVSKLESASSFGDLVTFNPPVLAFSVTKAELTVCSFGYVSGSFAFQVGQTATVQLDGGDPSVTKQVSILELGGKDVNVYAGTGAPVFSGSTTPGPGAHGFLISNTTFGLAILTPTATADPSVYYDLHVSGNAQTVGLPAGVELAASNLSLQVDGSSDTTHVVDFNASFPGTTPGLAIPSGGAPVYLDDSNRKLQVDTDATLTALGKSASGHFDFTDDNGNFSASATNLSASLQAGDPVNILGLANGTGSFTVTDDGVYGLASLTLTQGPNLPNVSITSGTSGMFQINSTANDQTVDGVNLTHGEVLFELDAPSGGTVGITVVGNTLKANQFFFKDDGSGNIDVSASDVSLSVTTGSMNVLQMTGGNLAFEFTTQGVAGKVSMQSVSSNAIPGLSISATGNEEVDINTMPSAVNTTIGNVPINVPAGLYLHVGLTSADVAIADVFNMSVGSFSLTADANQTTGTITDFALDAESVTFKAGPSSNPALTLTGSANFLFKNGDFTLTSATLGTSSISIPSVLNVDSPEVSVSNLEVDSTGATTGTIGVQAASATVFPGKAFTASVTGDPNASPPVPGLDGTFALGSDTFDLAIDHFELDVSNAVKATANGVEIKYDPSDTTDPLMTIKSGSVNVPAVGITGDITELDVYRDGFHFNQFSVTKDTATIGSLLTANNITVTMTDFGVTYGAAVTYSGSISVTASSASFGVAGGFSANATGLSGLVAFSDGNVSDVVISGSATASLGSVSITATNFKIDTGATDNTTPFVSFDSASATLGPITATVSGLDFMYDGSIETGSGPFSIDLSSSSSAKGSLDLPSWLPISISTFDISWPSLTQQPASFTITLSASVNTSTLFGLPLHVNGSFTNLQIDPDLLAEGKFPIVGLDAASLTLSGDLFGGTVTGGLTFGVANIRPDSTDPTDHSKDTLVPAGSPRQPGDFTEMYGMVQGGFTMAGRAGFQIAIGLSQLGPLGVLVSVHTPDGILLDPDTGLSINDFTGAVIFKHELPSFTLPSELRDFDKTLSTPGDAINSWVTNLPQQVLTQDQLSGGTTPDLDAIKAMLTGPIEVEGTATVFSAYLSQDVFNGQLEFALSTPDLSNPDVSLRETGPKLFASGTLNFFDKLSMSASLYADFSHIDDGTGNILFLSDIPNSPQLFTLQGALTFNFIDTNNAIIKGLPKEKIVAPILPTTSPTADLGTQQPNGGIVGLDTINQTDPNDTTQPYLDIVYRPTPGQTLGISSILNGGPQFTLSGPNSANIQIGTPTEVGNTGEFHYPIIGEFQEGDYTVHFIPGTWTDSSGAANETQSDETFTVFSKPVAFQMKLGSQPTDQPVAELLAPNNLLGSPLMELTGDVTLTAQLPPPGSTSSAPQLMTLDVSAELSLYYLGQVGTAAGQFVLDLNTNDASQDSDTGLFGAATPQLWGAIDVNTNLEKLKDFGINASTTFELQINTTDTPKTVTLRTPGQNGQGTTSKDVHIGASIFQVYSTGTFSFVLPAKSDNVWFGIDGTFYLQVTKGGLDAFAAGQLTIGPPSAPILERSATALLVINDQGLAGEFDVDLSSGWGDSFRLTADLQAELNTTGADQPLQLPSMLVADMSNEQKSHLAKLGLTSGGSITIPGGAPLFDGGNAAAGPYFVVHGQGDLQIATFDLDASGPGQGLYLAVTPTSLTMAAGFSVDNLPVVGTITGTADFTITTSGEIYGDAAITTTDNDIGGSGFSLDGQFVFDVNTTDNPQPGDMVTVGKATINPNGMIVPGVALVFGGELKFDGPSASFAQFNFDIAGTLGLTFNTQDKTATAAIDGTLEIPELPAFKIDKTVTLDVSGIVLDESLDLPDGAFEIGGSKNKLLTLKGLFELRVNTTNAPSSPDQGSIPAETAEIDIHNAELDLLYGVCYATGDVTIGIEDGSFDLNIPASNPITFSFFDFDTSRTDHSNNKIEFKVHGDINPSTFELTASVSVEVGDYDTAYADASMSVTLGNEDPIFAASFDASGHLFGVDFLDIGGSLTVDGSGTVTLGFTVPVVNTPVSYTIGTIPIPNKKDGPTPPALANVLNDGTLRLNVGTDAHFRATDSTNTSYGNDTSESYVVTHVSGDAADDMGETVLVSAFGFSQTYPGVKRILVNDTGIGDDDIQIGNKVTAPASLKAGSGNDFLEYDGSGSVTMQGGSGNGWLQGGSGTSSITAGTGHDTIVGGSGDDVQNVLTGGSGVTRIVAGSGDFAANDITAGTGQNTILVGSAGGTVTWSPGDGPTTVNGGGTANVVVNDANPNQNIVASTVNQAVKLTVGATTLTLAHVATLGLNLGGGGDTLNIGDLTAGNLGALNIDLTGHTSADSLSLTGADGGDQLALVSNDATSPLEVADQDFLTTTPSIVATTITGGATGDQLAVHAGTGNNSIDASSARTPMTLSLYGGTGTNTIKGSIAADFLYGGNGNNTIKGDGGNDVIHAGAGTSSNDSIVGGSGSVTVFGGAGNDTITAGTGPSAIYGGSGNNTIYASDNATWLDGGTGGADTLILTTASADTLDGNTLYHTGSSKSSGVNLMHFSSATVNVGANLTLNNAAMPLTVSNLGGKNVNVQQLAQAATVTTASGVNTIAMGPGGIGYVSPVVTITGGGGTGATAAATMSGGVITGIQLINPGSGFTTPPTVTITDAGGNGSGATATATILGTVIVNDIQAPLTANGGNFIVDRTANVLPDTLILNTGSLTGLNGKEIDFPTSLAALTLNLGSGDDSLSITGTRAPTTVNGGNGNDTFAISGAGNVVTFNGGGGTTNSLTIQLPHTGTFPTPAIGTNIQQLTVDSRKITTSPLAWSDIRGQLSVFHATTLFGPFDTTPAGHTSIISGDPSHDTLTVEDDVNQPQIVGIQGNMVQVQEGLSVVTAGGAVQQPTSAPVITPVDGSGNSQVYAADPTYQDLAVYSRDASSGALTPQQQIQDWLDTRVVGGLETTSKFGNSIAVSGNYAVVGAPGGGANGDPFGYAFVYKYDGITWNLITTLSPPSRAPQGDVFYNENGNDSFGYSVAITADYIAVGAPDAFSGYTTDPTQSPNLPANEGAVYVFGKSKTSDNWSYTAKLVPSDMPLDLPQWRAMGSSVAMTEDGSGNVSILTGAPRYFPDTVKDAAEFTGAAYLFQGKSGGSWSQAQEWTAPSDAKQDFRLGQSVALANGVAVVGAPGEIAYSAGAAYVWQNIGGFWFQIANLTEGTDQDFFGTSVGVEMGGDGLPRVFVGMSDSYDIPASQGVVGANGAIYDFRITGYQGLFDATYNTTRLTMPGADGTADGFGNYLSVANGDLVTSSNGALHLYSNIDSSPQLIASFRPEADAQGPYYGHAAALLNVPGGNPTIFAANPFANSEQGAVYFFGSTLAGATATALVGNTLYVTSAGDNSISAFQRDATTGALTFVQGLRNNDVQGTSTIQGLGGADTIAATPDGTTIFVGSNQGIAKFQRGLSTGKLTAAGSLGAPGLGGVFGLAVDATGTSLYAVGDGTMFRFQKVNGTWQAGLSVTLPSLTINGQSVGVGRLSSAVVSSNGVYVYVAAAGNNAILTFTRNTTSGALTYQSAVVNGQSGVDGIAGVSSLAITGDGAFLIANGPSENELAVFKRATAASGGVQVGDLLFVQRVTQGIGAITGIDPSNSVVVSPDGNQLYVGSPTQLTWMPLNTAQPSLGGFNITYTGIHQLTVNTAGGDDKISLGTTSEPGTTNQQLGVLNINANGGNDTVFAQDSQPNLNATVQLGTGNNTFVLGTTGDRSQWHAQASPNSGANTFSVRGAAQRSLVTLTGGNGDDTFIVDGSVIPEDDFTIQGNGSQNGNTLYFDSESSYTFPYIPYSPYTVTTAGLTGRMQLGTLTGTNQTSAATGSFPVHYFGIKTIYVSTSPVANANGPYNISEGGSVTLTSAGSTATQGSPTSGWDLTGSDTFTDALGSNPTLTWAQLNALGITVPGSYPVRLLVSDSAGNVNVATTTLNVADVAPSTPTVTAPNSVQVGTSASFTAVSTSDGGAYEPLTYTFTFSDGTTVTSSTGVVSHTFTNTGNASVTVTASDGFPNGVSQPATKSLTVTAQPTVSTASISGPSSVTEGALYTLTLGPKTLAATGWSINWGDGAIDNITGNPSSYTHTYQQPGNYPIGAVEFTSQGNVPTNTQTVHVTDVAPTVSIGGPTPATEGLYSLSLNASSHDPIASWNINWGDNSPAQTVFGNPSAVTHVYTAQEPIVPYVIAASATDSDSVGSNTTSLSVTITPGAPIITSAGVAAPGAVEGSLATLFANATIPGGEALTYTFSVNGTIIGSSTNGQIAHKFDSAGQYPVEVAVSADGGAQATATFTANVSDVAPTLTIAPTPANATIAEGTAITLNLAFSDPDNDTITGYRIDWGDGSDIRYDGSNFSPSHLYVDGGLANKAYVYDVTTDDNMVYGTLGTLPITVNPVPPTIALQGAAQVVLNQMYTLTLGAVNEAGNEVATSYTVYWGDGNSATFAGTPVAGTQLTHSYSSTGPESIKVALVNRNGTYDSAGQLSLLVLSDTGPTADADGPYTVTLGDSITLDASNSVDPLQSSGSLTYAWDLGSGQFTDAQGATPTFIAGRQYGPGPLTIRVQVTDAEGLSNVDIATVNIADVAPTATLANNGPVSEGSPVTVTFTNAASLSNVEAAAGFAYSFAIDPSGLATSYGAASSSASQSITFNDNGDPANNNGRIVYGRVFDQHGSYRDYTTTVTVNNVAPTATLANDGPVAQGSPATVSFTAAFDPSSVDTTAGFHYAFSTDPTTLPTTYAAAGTSATASYSFPDIGNHTIYGRIYDKDNGYTDASTTIAALNVPPSNLVLTPSASDIQEGGSVTLGGTFTDPGALDTHLVSVDWGDGSTPTTVNLGANVLGFSGLTHQYLDNPVGQPSGGYTITVIVSDSHNGTTSTTATVEVDNVAPTAMVSNAGPIDEGSSTTISFTAQLDPSSADTTVGFRYSFSTDATKLASTYAAAGTSSSQTIYFDDNGTIPVFARIFDKDGGYTQYETDVVVNSVAPTATFANDGPIDEGSSATISFTNPLDPSGADTAHGFHYSFSTDEKQLAGAYDTADTRSSQSIYFDDNGENGGYTVYGRIFDKDDSYTEYITTVVVNNVPPTATLSNDGPIGEGSSSTISFTEPFDPSGADTAAGFHYAFSTDSTKLPTTYDAAGTSASQPFFFGDEGNYTVYGRIFDKDNGYTQYNTTVTVNDVPPSNLGLTLSATQITEGTSVTLSGTFADPSAADSHPITINWGDGSTPTTLNLGAGVLGFSGVTHRYADNPTGQPTGSYTVTVTVADDDGSQTQASTTVEVDNVAPTATLSNSGPINEGSAAIVAFTGASDPSSVDTTASFRYSFSLNYNTLASSYGAAGTTASQSFPFADNGHYTVYGRIFDKDNGYTDCNTLVVVNNVPPTVTAGPSVPAQPGIPLTIQPGSFADPGIYDYPWTVDVSWGDGSSDTIFTMQTQGAIPAQMHTYALTGTDTVTVTVADKDGDKGSATLQVSVLPALFALDPTAAGALSVSGNAVVTIPGGVAIDSSSSSALSASGNAKLTTPTILVKGNVQITGNATVSGKITTGVSTPNPLAGLTYSPTIPASPPSINVAGSTSLNIQPGDYASISVSGNATLNMAPGVYVIAGGGLSVTGNANVTGQGVAIYNTSSSKGVFGSINLAGVGKINLTPPASGQPLAGILVFQDPANTKALSITGNGALGLNGTIYAPTATLTVSGNSTSQVTAVADKIAISGNSTFNDITLSAPSGAVAYSPSQVRDAYSVNSLAYDGTGQTIAIVDAYDNPQLDASLDQFDSQFGATASGATLYDNFGPASVFLTVLNQSGQASPRPTTDPSGAGVANWESESALDVEWTHAMAPGAQIILVEANSQSLADLMSAVATAAAQPGVSVVSMSWGFMEGQAVLAADEAQFDSVLTTPAGHTPVTFVASTGDYGSADPEYPAFSPNVVAVGGTTLTLNGDGSYNSETAWGNYSSAVGAFIASGGGVSQFEPQPTYQNEVQSSGYRTTPDVALLADPATGAWMADTYNLPADNAWQVVGGTSLSAPSWAGLIALVNQGRADAGLPTLSSNGGTTIQAALYSAPAGGFNTITRGTNGAYNVSAGYNLVTGLGSPNANVLIPALIAYQGSAAPNATANPGQGGSGSGNGGTDIAVFNIFNALPLTMPIPTHAQPTIGAPVSPAPVPQSPPVAPTSAGTISLPVLGAPQGQPIAMPAATGITVSNVYPLDTQRGMAPDRVGMLDGWRVTLEQGSNSYDVLVGGDADDMRVGGNGSDVLTSGFGPSMTDDAPATDNPERSAAAIDLSAAYESALADWALANDCRIDAEDLAQLVAEQ
jgi:hypothetical protein